MHVLEGRTGVAAVDRFRPAILVEIEDRHITATGTPPGPWGLVHRSRYTMHIWEHAWRLPTAAQKRPQLPLPDAGKDSLTGTRLHSGTTRCVLLCTVSTTAGRRVPGMRRVHEQFQ